MSDCGDDLNLGNIINRGGFGPPQGDGNNHSSRSGVQCNALLWAITEEFGLEGTLKLILFLTFPQIAHTIVSRAKFIVTLAYVWGILRKEGQEQSWDNWTVLERWKSCRGIRLGTPAWGLVSTARRAAQNSCSQVCYMLSTCMVIEKRFLRN